MTFDYTCHVQRVICYGNVKVDQCLRVGTLYMFILILCMYVLMYDYIYVLFVCRG